MYGKVDMGQDLLMQGSVEYKYCVHKKKSRIYEYVITHGTHYERKNRTLKIKAKQRKQVIGKKSILFGVQRMKALKLQ